MSDDSRRCIVIDGQPIVRLGIRGLLADRWVIEEVPDGDGALELLTSVGDFEVAIVETAARSDAGLIGSGTIRALHKTQPGLGIVAHAPRPDRPAVAEALEAGAIAYVCKTSPPAELRRAVDAAARAERFLDPAVRGGSSRRSTLTRRQRQILQLYADGNSTTESAQRLGLSLETVRTHTKAILGRLGAHDRAHAVAIAIRGSLIE